MVEVIQNKTDIDKIIAEKIKGKELIFTRYYRIRTAWRGIPDEKILEIFPKFDKVIAVEIKKLKFGDIGYELFYDIGNGITFSIATCPKDNKILIIHAIEYKRNLKKRFMRLE